MAKRATGVLDYVDQQIEALEEHVPAALNAFDEKGIHQARVATRRLKAAIDLLTPVIDGDAVRGVKKSGRRLRRRLGPLRDLDVMIGHLDDLKAATKFRPSVEWLQKRLTDARSDARQADARDGKKPAKLLRDFYDWRGVRARLKAEAADLKPLVASTLHEQFDAFSRDANVVAGVEKPADDAPVDVHAVRVSGKALRYTFEIAVAEGLAVPASVLATFKSMQDALGDWHDYVVLAERTLTEALAAQLSHHSPELAFAKLDLARLLLGNANKALQKFGKKWQKNAASLADALNKAVPLTREVSMPAAPVVTPAETDRDPPPSEETPPPAAPPTDEPPATQG